MIYQECISQLEKGASTTIAIKDSTQILKNFIQNYHEKLEEEYIFPRFEQKNSHVPLITTLRDQHNIGRSLAEQIMKLTQTGVVDKNRGPAKID